MSADVPARRPPKGLRARTRVYDARLAFVLFAFVFAGAVIAGAAFAAETGPEPQPAPTVEAPQPTPPPASSPTDATGTGLFRTASSIALEGGFQSLEGDSTAAQFLDYRDFREPAVVPLADLRVRRWDIDAQIRAIDLIEKDARYDAWIGKPGVFSAAVGWEGLPRTLEDDAVTLHHTADGNRILLPNDVQRSVQSNAANLRKFLKFTAQPVDLWMDRETTHAMLSVSPLRGLTLSMGSEDAVRRGKMARSVSTNFLNGADVTEWASPVDDRTRKGTFRAQYVNGQDMVAAFATVSEYSDRVGPLRVDNPLRTVDAEGTLFGNRSATQFLVSQPLDNQAKQLGLDAAVDLLWRMRLAVTLSSGSVKARHDFLPYTSNTAVRANFFYPDLPGPTYAGKVDTTSYSAALTGSALKLISYKVFARGYEYDNRTPIYWFPDYVVGDTRLANVPRNALPYGWKRDGQGADVRVRPLRDLSFTVGYQHERVKRTFREVDQTTEDTLRGIVDWKALAWLFLRGSYSGSSRTGDAYDPNAYAASFPAGVPGTQEGFPLLRRYDVAERRRRLVDLLAVFNFTNAFSIDYAASYRNNDYPDSRYGLVDDSTRHHVLGVNFAPFSPCTARIERANDFATRRLDARLRNMLFGQPADSPVNDWSDEISETGHTVSAEGQCFPEDEKWDLGFGLVQTSDRQTDDAAFTSGAFIDPDLDGHARRHPPIKRRFRETHARARFRLSPAFDLILKATFEEFEEGDPTQDVMSAPMGRIDSRAFESAYLGVRVDSYSAAIFDVFLGVHW